MKLLRLLTKPLMLGIYGFALTTFLIMLGIQTLAPKQSAAPAAVPTIGALVERSFDAPAVTLLTPSTWPQPVVLDTNTVILSPTGSTDMTPTAGPFMVITTDALTVFSQRYTLRTNYADPEQQLDALVTTFNRDAPGFKPATPYDGARYPGAMTVGYERANKLVIILLDAGEKGWIYIGLQAPEADFDVYDSTVFQPIARSLLVN
ncbi:MAG: hypothetical protein KF716_11775 [Anaerolineae bacterium]|nr:hypothetical protein [Anaerolineae bacterium]